MLATLKTAPIAMFSASVVEQNSENIRICVTTAMPADGHVAERLH